MVSTARHICITTEEAGWFVKSFYDYHHIEAVKKEKKVIGAAFWNVVEEKHHGLAEIADLWIGGNFRRRGLGARLLEKVINDMKQFFAKNDHTLKKVLVTTGHDNETAKKLYEKVGFKKTAVLTDLLAKGENELVYILTLNP